MIDRIEKPIICKTHSVIYQIFDVNSGQDTFCKIPQKLVLKSHRFTLSFPASRGLFTLVFGEREEKRPKNYSKRR